LNVFRKEGIIIPVILSGEKRSQSERFLKSKDPYG
jgi:hypothetical protein